MKIFRELLEAKSLLYMFPWCPACKLRPLSILERVICRGEYDSGVKTPFGAGL